MLPQNAQLINWINQPHEKDHRVEECLLKTSKNHLRIAFLEKRRPKFCLCCKN